MISLHWHWTFRSGENYRLWPMGRPNQCPNSFAPRRVVLRGLRALALTLNAMVPVPRRVVRLSLPRAAAVLLVGAVGLVVSASQARAESSRPKPRPAQAASSASKGARQAAPAPPTSVGLDVRAPAAGDDDSGGGARTSVSAPLAALPVPNLAVVTPAVPVVSGWRSSPTPSRAPLTSTAPSTNAPEAKVAVTVAPVPPVPDTHDRQELSQAGPAPPSPGVMVTVRHESGSLAARPASAHGGGVATEGTSAATQARPAENGLGGDLPSLPPAAPAPLGPPPLALAAVWVAPGTAELPTCHTTDAQHCRAAPLDDASMPPQTAFLGAHGSDIADEGSDLRGPAPRGPPPATLEPPFDEGGRP